MKLGIKHIFNLLIVLLLVGQGKIYAQQEEPEREGEVENAEILITKDRQLTLPNSDKIFEKSRIINNAFTPELRPNIFKPYSYIPQKAKPNFRAVTPKQPRQEQRYANYIKASLGNFQSGLFQTQLFLLAQENKVVAIDIDHLSFGKGATGNSDSKSSKSGAGITSKFIGKKAVFSAGLNFKSIRENFYGHGILPRGFADFNPESQKFNLFEIGTNLKDNNTNDLWSYTLGLNYSSLSDNYKASESIVESHAEVVFKKKIKVEIEGQTSTYSDVTELGRSQYRILPTYSFELNNFKIKTGLSFNYQNDTTNILNDFKAFPFLGVSYPVSNRTDLYGLIDAGFIAKKYRDIIMENPYVNQQLVVQNEETAYDFKIGMRSRPMERLSLDAFIDIASIKNKAIYLNSGTLNSRFDINYLSNPTGVIKINFSSNYLINEENKISFMIEKTNYDNKISTLYHLPTLELEVEGSHKISNKFNLNWNFYVVNGISIINLDTNQEESLSIQNLDLSINYHLKERIDLFLDMSNLLDKNYQRFLNYEMRRLQLKIGAFYRF
jgi:hypothetical protein